MAASNVSFGILDRNMSTQLSLRWLSRQVWLTCPITNPLVTEISTAVLAADLSLGKDEFEMRWIKSHRKRSKK